MTSNKQFSRAGIFTGCLALLSATTTPAQTFTEDGLNLIGNFTGTIQSVSLADIDNDGDLDILYQGNDSNRRLYRNNFIGLGTFTFTNITGDNVALSTTGVNGWSAAWGDYDGDGDVDVFLGQANTPFGSAGDLMSNNGDNTFSNVSATTINDVGFHQNVAWNDIDNDGDLDLIIGMEGPERHEIYLQGPPGTFTAVGAATGFQADYGTKSYGMAIGDYDADGDLDIYIATCNGASPVRNSFFKNYLNEDGYLHFVDIADSNGTQNTPYVNTYGTEFVDFNDDGLLELYRTGADTQQTRLWRNDGNGVLTDVATILGHGLLSNTGSDLNGSRAIDYDNDGDLDLFFHDNLSNPANSARRLYRNDGNWVFTDVTVSEGISNSAQGGYDSTWGDLDRDGDLDLLCSGSSGVRKRVFISNASTNNNHWLMVRLHGPTENTRAIGAQLYATIHKGTDDERTLRRDANTNAGTFNQSDLPVHFGLGTATVIDELRIVWPGGDEQTLPDVEIDRYLDITKPVPTPTPTVSPSPSDSPEPTESISPSPSDSPVPTASISPSPSDSPMPTASISPSPSDSPQPTASPSPSMSPTGEPSPTPTASPSVTASVTPHPPEVLPVLLSERSAEKVDDLNGDGIVDAGDLIQP